MRDKGRPVRFGAITPDALDAWRRDWRPAFPDGVPGAHWDWAALRARYGKLPYRFEAAVRGPRAVVGLPVMAFDVLCGLAVGRMSAGRWIVRVQYLAGTPVQNHPRKGALALAVIEAAEAYCRAWGGTEVRFEDPLPGTEPVYGDILQLELVSPPSDPRYYSDPL